MFDIFHSTIEEQHPFKNIIQLWASFLNLQDEHNYYRFYILLNIMVQRQSNEL